MTGDSLEAIIVLVVLAVLAVPVLLGVLGLAVLGLRRRVAELERALAALRPPAPTGMAASPPPAEAAHAPAAAAGSVAAAVPSTAAGLRPSAAPPPLPPAGTAAAHAGGDAGAPRVPAENVLLRVVKRWFTVGNVPVKIGVLVALAGVAALLKYASDQGLLQLPVALRLSAVAAAALLALGFAWRRREGNRVFALSVQGGAIGTLLLVVFASSRLYGLVDAGPAFALSVILVAGAALLAVLQNAQALAAFALLAGFLAPVWLSTGGGNHVALFSYYALVNAAVVAIAWFRSWRLLNLLGFASTFDGFVASEL